MTDIRLNWDLETYSGDIGFAEYDLENEDGLASAVIMSIFTWRRANDSDETDGDKKGWWGDSFAETENDKIGSRLWLLLRSKITQTTLLKIKEVVSESLQWLIDDGVASNVVVNVIRNTEHSIFTIQMDVQIIRPNGTAENLKFNDLWKNTK